MDFFQALLLGALVLAGVALARRRRKPPPAAPPEELTMSREEWRKYFLTRLRPLTEDSGHAFHPQACRLYSWCTWLFEKSETVRELRGQELASKVTLWRKKLDYYLWTDPAGIEDLVATWTSLRQRQLLVLLQESQVELRRFLAEHEIERIDAMAGDAFRPGLVEDKGVAVATEDPTLHDKVCRVDPGDGGYRWGGIVLAPSLALRYEFRTRQGA